MRTAIWTLGAVLLLGGAPATADSYARVVDLSSGPTSGVPGLQAVVFDGQLYFRGKEDADYDLWVWNGVDAPTIVPGADGVTAFWPVAWNGAVYFRAQTAGDAEIWRYDGVSAAQAINLNAAASSAPEDLVAVGARLCCRATLATIGQELACWNGVGSTFEAYDLRTGSLDSSPTAFGVAQGRLYFTAFETTAGNEPWKYDSPAAPTLLADLFPGNSSLPRYFTEVGDDVYFAATPTTGPVRLFRHDGVNPPQQVSADFAVTGGLAEFRGRLYAVGHDEATASIDTLFRLDGDELVPVGGTTALTLVDELVPFAESLYFVSGASDFADEIYRFSGVGPPVPVTTFTSVSADMAFRHLVPFGDRLIFTAKDATAGTEIWWLTTGHLWSDGFEHGDFTAWSGHTP